MVEPQRLREEEVRLERLAREARADTPEDGVQPRLVTAHGGLEEALFF
ncbi:MAG: hypothetical protein IPG17_13900 [Sandaracinaceae bacterium]|nr:hypothetical protein [Sandaracinaceae bacterium]